MENSEKKNPKYEEAHELFVRLVREEEKIPVSRQFWDFGTVFLHIQNSLPVIQSWVKFAEDGCTIRYAFIHGKNGKWRRTTLD